MFSATMVGGAVPCASKTKSFALFAAAAHWGDSAWQSIDGDNALELVAIDKSHQFSEFTLYALGWSLVALSVIALVVVVAKWSRDMTRTMSRRERVGACFMLAPILASLIVWGLPKGWGSVSFPSLEGQAYLVDNGSYVTNDLVHVNFTRRIVPDSAPVFVDYRPMGATNDTDWVNAISSTFAEFTLPYDYAFEGAQTNNWLVYTTWTPGPSVQTNGMLHAEWGKSLNDSDYRAAGLAVGIPAQTRIDLDGQQMAIPSTSTQGD